MKFMKTVVSTIAIGSAAAAPVERRRVKKVGYPLLRMLYIRTGAFVYFFQELHLNVYLVHNYLPYPPELETDEANFADDLDSLDKVWKQDWMDVLHGKKLPRVVRKCVRCNADGTICDVVLCHLEMGYQVGKTPEEVKKTGRPLYAVPHEHEEDWLTADERSALMDQQREKEAERKARKHKQKEEKERLERERYEKEIQELRDQTPPQTEAEKNKQDKKKEEEERKKEEEQQRKEGKKEEKEDKEGDDNKGKQQQQQQQQHTDVRQNGT
ncbi:hypothetical protein E4U55_006389 [Claviceps digitariae]|nr:hypothetical protein E4U55_006389 [Claviceps digitariae]